MTLNDLILFAYESGVCMAVLFGLYWIFLRNETYYQFNRIYLLGTVLISFMLPLGRFSLSSLGSESSAYIVISSVGEAVRIPEMTIADVSTGGFSFVNNWQQIVLAIYLVGGTILLARMLLGITGINRLKKSGKRIDHYGYSIVYIKQQFAPFSFFRTIFINEGFKDTHERCNVIDHELQHIKQLHTYDNILIEIILAIFWFNPFIWLIKRALRTTHEYLADYGVINSDTGFENYQSLLLKQIHGLSTLVVTNNFNYMIKNRIKMMCKSKSTALAKAKPLLLFPVLICLILIFACSGNEQLQDNIINEQADISKSDADNLISDNEYVYPGSQALIIVEEMPYYPGGEEGLYEDIYNILEYSRSEQRNDVSGMVIVRFIVNSQGDVIMPEVLRGFNPSLDAEAIRVVESLPERFTPGKQAGKAVNVYYIIRIQFQPPA